MVKYESLMLRRASRTIFLRDLSFFRVIRCQSTARAIAVTMMMAAPGYRYLPVWEILLIPREREVSVHSGCGSEAL